MDEHTLNKDTFLSVLRGLVEQSGASESRKQYFQSVLTETRFKDISGEDLIELLEILRDANQKIETEVLESNDPDAIYALTVRKHVVNDLLYKAQIAAFGAVGIAPDTDPGAIVDKSDPNWLLDYYAGLTD
jgi:hypothetical protein